MAQIHVPILVDWDDIKDHMAKSDIVEVVRCKDCKYYEKVNLSGVCGAWDAKAVGENDYCSDAERKDNDKRRSD